MRENPNTVLRAINTFAIENITWEAWQQLTNEDLQPMMQQVHAGMINRPGLRGFINEFLENHYGNTPMTNEVIDAAVGTIQEALTAQGRTTTPDTIRLHVMAWINNRGLDMEVVNNEQTEVMTPSVITHPNINHCGSRSVVIVAAGLLASALSAYYFGSF